MTLHAYFMMGYLGLVVLTSFYFYIRVKSQNDFAVAGKTLPAVAVFGTLLATSMGGGTVIGGTNSIAYHFGHFSAILFGLGIPAGALVLYFLRHKVCEAGANSIPELFEIKFGKKARVTSSVIISLGFIAIASYQFKAFAFILNHVFGIDVETGLVIALVVISLTAVLGGLYSVVYTDLISVVLMSAGIIVGVLFVFISKDGFSVMQQNLPEKNLVFVGDDLLLIISAFLSLFFIIIADQNNFQRFVAAKSDHDLKRGIIYWIIGLLIITPLVAYGSSLARAIYGDSIEAGESLIVLASQSMPAAIGGLALAAITGFILTSGNSVLLSSSLNITGDIVLRYFFKKPSVKKELLINRLVMIILAFIAYAMIRFFPHILTIQLYAYTMYGAAIMPVFLMALLSDSLTERTAVLSMFAAALVTIIMETLKHYGITSISSILFAFPASVIVIYIGYLFNHKARSLVY